MDLQGPDARDSSEMAELLGLDRELVAFIIANPTDPERLDDHLGISHLSKGERVLEEAQDASEEVRMGYAYQGRDFGELAAAIH